MTGGERLVIHHVWDILDFEGFFLKSSLKIKRGAIWHMDSIILGWFLDSQPCMYIYVNMYIPRAPMTSIFEGQPPETRPFQ